jgi:hypothetical protein
MCFALPLTSLMQVLLDALPGLLGCVVEVEVTAASRWSVTGKLLQVRIDAAGQVVLSCCIYERVFAASRSSVTGKLLHVRVRAISPLYMCSVLALGSNLGSRLALASALASSYFSGFRSD